MKSTSTQTASGIQFAMSFYDIKEGEKPKQVVDSALADLENSVQRMMNYSCDGRFNSIETKPEQLFKNKEKLDMVLGYFYDNYIQFDGACIVQAQFKSDIQLFSFLDFFF
ncbi:hypothetical protein HY488_01555, partial [Candidatus Woesearchaeota archaeon]|nr:hypothetical protein [Candidatus Woesearchaeota archaeon]